MNSNDLSHYDDRKVAIQVTGLPSQTIKRKSNYTIVVPYERLNKAIQQISRMGGRVVNITVQSSSLINVQKATISPKTPNSIVKSESVAIVEEAGIDPEPIQSEEKVISPAVEIDITSSPETRTIDDKVCDLVSRKASSYRTIHPKRTSKKTSRVRGKKARRRSKTYSFN